MSGQCFLCTPCTTCMLQSGNNMNAIFENVSDMYIVAGIKQ